MASQAKSPAGQPNTGGGPSDKSEGRSKLDSGKLTTMVASPQFSFSSDVSPEFIKSVEDITHSCAQYMDRNLAISALGADGEHPFSAVRDGETVHIMYPQHVKQGDLLGGLITVISSLIPTCVIHQGTASWSEPEWTSESRAHLAGLIAGIRDIPDSFAHTSSPSDLARISLWITACSAALSRPGGVSDAHGDVLPPSVGGGKSASKYMTRILSGLRSNVTDESIIKAVDTLGILLKLWQRAHYEQSLTIVRKCKIAWSTVLFRAAPTTIIKGKKNRPDQTVVRSPPKPSRSPWLANSERSALGELFKDDWSRLETIREEWVKLVPEQQHRQFNHYLRRVKQHYETLNNISNSVHAKLGKRKHWIEAICKEDGYKPKPKRDESESFLLASHFFTKDLSLLDFRVKRIFSPITYLSEERFSVETSWSNCFPTDIDRSRITAADFTLDDDGPAYRLWQIWAEMFKPIFEKNPSNVEEAPPTADRNFFQRLFSSENT